ncbi:MAG: rhomboid family intramembrane serine protease [Gammaproteobacteria bacterium]
MSETFKAAVRFAEARGPLSWFEPSRNDLRLVGSGSIEVGAAIVRISGRRQTLLGGPFLPYTRDFVRERIFNVEVEGRAIRLEYREPHGSVAAVTFQLASEPEAAQLVQRLPAERSTDFRPQLPDALQFEERLRQRTDWTPVTTTIIAINILVFAAMAFAGAGLLKTQPAVHIAWGSNFGPFTADGEWWRLITCAFLHFGIFHLLFNMWALAATGPLVERLYGSTAFALAYLTMAVASSLASHAVHPDLNSAGASGAIFGVYGLLLAALLRGRRSIPAGVVKPLRASVLLFTLYSLTTGFLSTGVDNWAHVGGLVAGVLLGLVLSRGDIAERKPSLGTVIPVTLAASAILFAGIALILPRTANRLEGSAAFWNAQHWIAKREWAVSREQTQLWQQVRERKLDDYAYSNAIESDVLPVWREAERRMNRVVLPSESPLTEQFAALKTYIGIRRSAFESCVAGARTHNRETLDQCAQQLARGDALAQGMIAQARSR